MMNLQQKLNEADEKSFNTWFKRWYSRANLEERLLVAARKGYRALVVFDQYSDVYPDNRSDYVKRRLNDPRFVVRLQEILPDVRVATEAKTHHRLLLNPVTAPRVVIRWGDEVQS